MSAETLQASEFFVCAICGEAFETSVDASLIAESIAIYRNTFPEDAQAGDDDGEEVCDPCYEKVLQLRQKELN